MSVLSAQNRLENFIHESPPLVVRLARAAFARLGMPAHELDDFISETWVKLLDDDMRVARRCCGADDPESFLRVVVTNLARDYRIAAWGKWRPSARAHELGPLAVEAEVLVHRDRFDIEQAARTLRSRGRSVDDRTLASLLAELPYRPARRAPQAIGPRHAVVVPDATELDSREVVDRLVRVLRKAFADISEFERELIQRRFAEQGSIASMIRTRGLDGRRTYRQIAACLRRLRVACERAGISAGEAMQAVGSPELELFPPSPTARTACGRGQLVVHREPARAIQA